MKSLFRGMRLIFFIWIGLVVLAIALGFVHQAVQSRGHRQARPVAGESR